MHKLAAAPTLTLTVVNTALNPAQAVLYVGKQAQLLVTLTNNTGAALGLATGHAASTLDFYLPPSLALQPAVAALCAGIGVPGWAAAPSLTNAAVLRLTFVGGGGAGTTWANGAAIRFTLPNVSSAAAPTTASVVAVPTNVGGANVPDRVPAPPLSLQPAPPAGAVSLAGLLEAGLDNEGILYVSTDDAPTLANTLQLSLKNIRVDANGNLLPLYSGTTSWADLRPAPQPQITAWFVYDTDAGGLAPADPNAPNSAWTIRLDVVQDQTGGWTPSGPVPTTDGSGPQRAPQWLLQPAAGNSNLFGAGDAANLTVAFHDVVSLTPPGHTQLYLACTGFWQNETTAYEPLLLTLDINKEAAPPPKVISFLAPQAEAHMTLPVNRPGQQLTVQFAWSLTGIAKIELAPTEVVAMQPYSKKYDTGTQQGGVVYDTATVSFSLLSDATSENVIFTLTAYDTHGQVISNDSQITFYIDNQMFVDPAGRAYATVQIGNQRWMAQNLDYDAGESSLYYKNDPSYATPYGRLYKVGYAQQNLPPGWRLPTADDVTNLLNAVGSSAGIAPCSVLLAGGSSGFEGQLGGLYDWDDTGFGDGFIQLGDIGYYWCSTPSRDPFNPSYGGPYTFVLEANYGALLQAWEWSTEIMYNSVRYVRDL